MDEELRRLERLAAQGDERARADLDARWRRLGLGWWGDELPDGVERGAERGRYAFPDRGVELEFLRLEDRRRVALIPAIAGLPPHPPPVTFDGDCADALLERGFRWALVDMAPAPTVSSRSLGGHIRYCQRFEEAGGRLGCFGGVHTVRLVFELLGLADLMGWAETREEALRALTSA